MFYLHRTRKKNTWDSNQISGIHPVWLQIQGNISKWMRRRSKNIEKIGRERERLMRMT